MRAKYISITGYDNLCLLTDWLQRYSQGAIITTVVLEMPERKL